eukprot:scaffold1001_cov334-Prasinococcus_capsulatus_cf.AAC.1
MQQQQSGGLFSGLANTVAQGTLGGAPWLLPRGGCPSDRAPPWLTATVVCATAAGMAFGAGSEVAHR